ncbi:MAG: hypothetical protein QOK02_5897 [Mycobacterium sp.]|nr:hypothetical protein [Mycobacterium sp.]
MHSYLAPAHRLTITAAACLALLAVTVPSATAEPTTDSQGYVDSTARCSSPNTAAAFGSTETSRVAICQSPSGQYEYRGVRVRDGAKLIIAATRSSDGKFVAENDGNTYTVSPRSLVVSEGSVVIRTETMVDYHGPESPTTPTASTTPTVTAPTTTSTTTTSPTTTTPTTTTSLPPPLPAERGGTPR